MPDRHSNPASHPSRPARKVSFHPHVTVLTSTDCERQLAHAESALAEATARLNWLVGERSRFDVLQSNSRQHLRDMTDYVLSTHRELCSSNMAFIERMQSTDNGWGHRSPEADQWAAIVDWHSANHTLACTRLRTATESDHLLRATAESFSDQIIDQALRQAMDAGTAVNALERQIGHAQGILSQVDIALPDIQRVQDLDAFSTRGALEYLDDERDPLYPQPDPPVFLWRSGLPMDAGGEMPLLQQSDPIPMPYSVEQHSDEQTACEMDWAGVHAGHHSAF